MLDENEVLMNTRKHQKLQNINVKSKVVIEKQHLRYLPTRTD